MQQSKSNLLQQCAQWKNDTKLMPVADEASGVWAPSAADLTQSLQRLTKMDLNATSMGLDSDGEFSDTIADDWNEALEMMDLMMPGDIEEDEDDTDMGYVQYSTETARALSKSPRKRGRYLDDE